MPVLVNDELRCFVWVLAPFHGGLGVLYPLGVRLAADVQGRDADHAQLPALDVPFRNTGRGEQDSELEQV